MLINMPNWCPTVHPVRWAPAPASICFLCPKVVVRVLLETESAYLQTGEAAGIGQLNCWLQLAVGFLKCGHEQMMASSDEVLWVHRLLWLIPFSIISAQVVVKSLWLTHWLSPVNLSHRDDSKQPSTEKSRYPVPGPIDPARAPLMPLLLMSLQTLQFLLHQLQPLV